MTVRDEIDRDEIESGMRLRLTVRDEIDRHESGMRLRLTDISLRKLDIFFSKTGRRKENGVPVKDVSGWQGWNKSDGA